MCRLILGKVVGPILNVGTTNPSEFIINCDILIEFYAPSDMRGWMGVKRSNGDQCVSASMLQTYPINKSRFLVIIITGK